MSGSDDGRPLVEGSRGHRPLDLRQLTAARVALGRSGAGVPTRAHQRFVLDHARAREAVWTPIDWAPVESALGNAGLDMVRVESGAEDRATYLRRPDLGRALSQEARERLEGARPNDGASPDVAIVVADGLSATAVALNAAPLVLGMAERFAARGWRVAPAVLATQARVALGDDAGEALGARLCIVLIGERPGLSAADSLGAYLTFDPRPGTPDSRRNCISNIREGGLAIADAARQIEALAERMFSQERSGVALARDATPPSIGDGS